LTHSSYISLDKDSNEAAPQTDETYSVMTRRCG
jgi:hypothetical protein